MDRRSFILGTSAIVTTAGVSGHSRAARASAADWSTLQASISGTVVLPADSAYAQAIQLYQGQFDVTLPQAVVYCQSASDVRAALAFAQQNGIAAVPRAGGHSNAGYSTGTGMVIDVTRLNQVSVSSSGEVTVGAGIRAIDALTALAPGGLVIPSGTCATVAAGGFVMGGGIGPLTRGNGVACDALCAAEVVLADGRIVQCSASRYPDLFWALRGGGGGNFGVVTSYTLKGIPVSQLADYSVVWPFAAGPEVVAAWQSWIAGLPTGMYAELLAVFLPGQPAVLNATGTSTGSLTDLQAQVDRLAGLVSTAPLAKTTTIQSYQQTLMKLWGCATKTSDQCHVVGQNPDAQLPRGAFGRTRGRLIGSPLSSQAIGEVLAGLQINQQAGQIRVMSLRAMGGQANAVSRNATAFVHRTSLYNLNFVFALPSPAATDTDKAALLTALDAGFATFDPYSNGESFQNFMDPVLSSWRQSYYAENYAALTAVKRRYDPHGFFHFAQSIGS